MNIVLRRRLAGAGLAMLVAGTALAAPAVTPARTSIPFKQDADSGGTLAARAAGVLVLAGLAAFGAAVAIRRFGLVPGAAAGKIRRLRLAESVRLSRRSVLHVVDYDGERLLFAESDQGIALVSTRAAGGADA